ncbi:MAG: ATP-binding protein [Tissierellaceae bacterium]|nr:ATP-binding protein [Tissierellaceae bacterium]
MNKNNESIQNIAYTDIIKRMEIENELRKSKENYAFIIKLSDELRSLSDEISIKDSATRLLTEHLNVSQSSYGDFYGDKLIISRETQSDSTLNMKGTYSRSNFSEEMDMLLSDNEVVYSDVFEYPMFSTEHRDYLLSLNIRANITVPILKDGDIVAALSVRNSSPRIWSKEDVEVVRETAERTWVAIERARFEKALQENEAKYRKLFETSNNGFWWTDEYGYVVETNEGTAKMLGYSQEELVGKFWAEFVADEWLDEGYRGWNARQSGKSSSYEIELKKKNGNYIWAIISGVPLMDEDGEYVGTLVAFKDITEQKKAEEELYKSKKIALALVSELEKADKNKNEFISRLSHELRNPLATISGGIDLLQLKIKDGDALDLLKILKRQTGHLSKLVDDLLDITRVTQKKIILRKETVNLNTLLKDISADLKPQFERKGIKLLEYICTQPIVVKADPLRITQCIGNILANALKFTQENGIVAISLQIEEKNAVISVKDNGIGISPEILPKIFEPFQQDFTNDYHNKGLGLGLSIVKDTMEMHGGDVYASSPGLGNGSTFTLRLPLL